MSAAGKRLLRLLYPARCICCRHVLEGDEDRICSDCLPHLAYTADADRETVPGKACGVPSAAHVAAPFFYEGLIRQAILRYKFQNRASYAPVFARYMADAVVRACAAEALPTLITYVPLSGKRLRARGYDQARLLAEETGRLLGVPVHALLAKTTDNGRQSARDLAKRRANVIGVYTLCPAAAEAEGQRVWVVDDIITSGATMEEAVKTVWYARPASVSALAAAYTRAEPGGKKRIEEKKS